MRALFLVPILLAPAAASADSPLRRAPTQAPAPAPAASAAQSANCQAPTIREADRDSRQPTRPQSLGELPAGNLYLTVQRDVDGCIEPVLVRQGFGSQGSRR